METAVQDLFGGTGSAPLAIIDLLINLCIAGALAFLLAQHYRVFGSTLASRETFGKVFPFVALTTALLIAIVKSSLALSLGLVGALSIVRFRTPVKEPEELAYMFLAITIGLGLGADYRIATVSAVFVILAIVTLVQLRSRRVATRNLYVNLGIPTGEGELSSGAIEPVHEILGRHCRAVDLRRMDTERERIELTYFIDVPSVDALSGLTAELEKRFPNVRVTLLDQGRMPSL
ncbi:MAG: DUF4956 domain-containing protein [Myxococcota bacterium]|jgi:hypothetical protein